jgi:hemerythrin-like metal-binding protein
VHYARWSKQLETGDPEVDQQHRALYALVNDLNAGALISGEAGAIDSALERILRYVSTHFATEEALMERYAYPAAEEHIAIHRDFAQAATGKVTAHLAGETVSLPELAQFMQQWLDTHIDQHDRPLIAHVRRQRTS